MGAENQKNIREVIKLPVREREREGKEGRKRLLMQPIAPILGQWTSVLFSPSCFGSVAKAIAHGTYTETLSL